MNERYMTVTLNRPYLPRSSQLINPTLPSYIFSSIMSDPISYFHKIFDPVPLDAETLQRTHRDLCKWIKQAVDLIDTRESQGMSLNSPRDNIYSGDLGV